jgi:hypothetical protein
MSRGGHSASSGNLDLRQLRRSTSLPATETSVLNFKLAAAFAKSTAVDDLVEQKTAGRSEWGIVSADCESKEDPESNH